MEVHAPGRSRIRLATMPSITSEGIDAARGHQDLVATLVELGAVIFHRRGKCRMPLAGLCQIDSTFGGASQCRLVDLEGGDLSTQDRILQTTLLVGADRVRGDLPERPADAALAH